MPASRRTGRAVVYVFLFAIVLVTAYPFVFMVLGSFKENYEILASTQRFWPQNGIDFRKYRFLFNMWPLMRNMFNSTLITLVCTASNVLFCSLSGYAFAKFRFPGRNALFLIVLSSMMMPMESRIVPTYIIGRALNGTNTYWILIVPSMVTAFGIFMMRTFTVSSIPTECLESARMEGASEWGIAFRIALPMLRPGMVSLAVLTFMNIWNDFLWPLVMVTKKEMFTVTVAIRSLTDTSLDLDYGVPLAAAAISSLPILVFYAIFSRYLIEGIVEGAGKEM